MARCSVLHQINDLASVTECEMSEKQTEHEMVKCPECATLLREEDSRIGCPACLLRIGLQESRRNHQDEQHFAERYRIDSFMGRGGMGQIFKAVDAQLGRAVAIKLLVSNRYQDHEKVKRFRQEALTLSKVNHPNVCTIHDVGVSAEGPYIVMELVRGQTIAELVKGEAMPMNQALELMLQACRGIHAIHAKGIVHRDIKPSNVMVAAGNLVKIVDFGLATRASKSRSDGTVFDEVENTLTDEVQTVEGHIVGTPNYMSPEQASGRFVDARTDVFSLGTVFYFMLTGRPPFQAETPMLTMHAIISRDYKPVRTLNPALPQSVANIVDEMLADIDDRFGSLAPVMAAIEMQIANPSLENTIVEVCGVSEVDEDCTRALKSRSEGASTRTISAFMVMACILMVLGIWFWPVLLPERYQDASSDAPVLMFNADGHQKLGEVLAVVIDPVDFVDQQSPDSEASDVERKFYELMKQMTHEVLAKNAVPVRVFDQQAWEKVASATRLNDGSLDFPNTVSRVLRENDAKLFITIGGYFDEINDTYLFEVTLVDSEGTGVDISHMEFPNQLVEAAEREAVKKAMQTWFDDKGEFFSADE